MSTCHRCALLGCLAHNIAWSLCRYQKQFQAHPSSYKRLTKEGGGYWFTKVPQGPARPFTAGSTYHAELQRGGPTAQHQLEGTVGLRSTNSCHLAACRSWPLHPIQPCACCDCSSATLWWGSCRSWPLQPLQQWVATHVAMLSSPQASRLVGSCRASSAAAASAAADSQPAGPPVCQTGNTQAFAA